MMRSVLNSVLLAGLVIMVFLTWFLRRDYTRRNYEILPGMVNSVPYNAFDPNGNFTDGKTLQFVGENTIAHGFSPLHYAANPEDAKRAGEELINPLPDTISNERGEKIFLTFCQPCHGLSGLGDGNIVKRGFPPPPSLLAEKAIKMKDGQLFHIITNGQNNMPSLASQVERIDRWRVINYVRSLQKNVIQQSQITSK